MHSIINMVFWSILANYKAALSHQNKVNVGMSFFQNNTLSVGHNYYYTGYNRTIPINHTASLNGTYPTLLKSITDYICLSCLLPLYFQLVHHRIVIYLLHGLFRDSGAEATLFTLLDCIAMLYTEKVNADMNL